MAGSKETPGDRRARDEALLAAAEAAEREAAAAERPAPERRPAPASGRATIASAATVPLNDRRAIAKLRAQRQAWQTDAWDYVRELPEVGATLRFAANMMSKIRLWAAVRPDPEGEPVPVDDEGSGLTPFESELAKVTLERLGDGTEGGWPSLLRTLDWNLCEVTGEAYLHGHEDPETKRETWAVRSVDELVAAGDHFELRTALGAKGEKVPASDAVKRLWDPDPRFGSLATSPMREVLSTCEVLLLLSRAMRADAMSHLNSGILVKAHEMSFGGRTPAEADADEPQDAFEESLNQLLMDSVEDPGSSSQVAPGVISAPAEFAEKDKYLWHLTFKRDIDDKLVQWIESLVMRLARGLNMPVEVTRGLADCVDPETQIRTPDGWRRYDEVQAGDEVLTLNHETGLSEWQRLQHVAVYGVDGEMWSMEGRSHSSLSTVDHRWPVLSGRGARRWRRSVSMKDHYRVVCAAPSGEAPDEAKYADALVEAVAWFWTEGTLFASGGAKISQSAAAHPEHCDRIRRCLTALAGPPSEAMHSASRGRATCSFPDCGWPVHGDGLCNAHRQQRAYGCELRPVRRTSEPPEMKAAVPAWRERPLSNGMADFLLNKPLADEMRAVMDDRKVVDPSFIRALTAAQLELFIDVSARGDGTFMAGGSIHLHQAVEERTDAFELACLLAGRSITRREKDVYGGVYAPQWSHRFMAAAKRVTNMRVRNMRRGPVPYRGLVWCPVVPNGTWLARRNGSVYFTGNTTYANASVAKKSEWDSYGEPRAVLMVDALTVGYYREALVEGGMDPDTAATVFVWYDPAGALASPDPADYADKDHADGVISDDARRKAHGWNEADAPDDLELLRRMIFDGKIRDPGLVVQVLRLLGIADLEAPAPSMGQAVAAAANPPGLALGRRLAAIDRDLRLRVHVAAEQAMRRLLDRAGAKVRPKLGRDGPAATAAASIPNRRLCASLGREVVTAAAGDLGDVVDGAFDELADDLGAWVEIAQRAAVAEVERHLGPLSPGAAEELRAAQARGAAAARERLREAMTDLAGRRLYDPAPGAAAVGEADASATVPAGLVREVLALAGGDKPQGGDGGPLTSPDGGPVGGVATGPDLMAATGGVEGYVWDYGSAPRAPFEPHLALDGVAFESFDSDVLANTEGWPDLAWYAPGDHDGCVCDAIPVILTPDESGD